MWVALVASLHTSTYLARSDMITVSSSRSFCVDTVEKDREGPLIWPDVGRHPADSEAKEQLSFDRAER